MTTLSIIAIFALIKTPELLIKARKLWNGAPEYFFHDAASSSGKYHPAFDLGEGGTYRHSLLVAYFAHEGALAQGLPQRMIDICTAAALLHDLWKRGFEGGEHTAFEHPLYAASYVREAFPGDEDMELVASAIESHMGKWNTSKYSDAVLPLPMTQVQCIVSMADMIASRKILSELSKAETWDTGC